MEFLYSADGTLLQKKSLSGSTVNETRDYVAGLEFVDGTLESIGHAQGRVYYTNGANPRYEYTINDHLGNARIMFSDLNKNGKIEDEDEILWEGHYYPFGLGMKGPWMDRPEQESNYKYNGIEQVDDFGLGVNMATFRVLDSSNGRWWQVDPKAEYMYGYSPYCSMLNNPISHIDPNGDIPALLFVGAAIIGGGQNVYNNWDKISKNPWSAIGYGLSGAAGGAVSVVNPALGGVIAAGGNIITDAASGNIPEFNDVSDVLGYAGGAAFDAISVAGSGALAKAGVKGLSDLGVDWATDMVSSSSVFHSGYSMELTILDDGTALEQIVPNLSSTGSHLNNSFSGLSNTASTGLGLHGNSVNSQKPSGYYEITYQDGTTYHGVGSESRMRQSAKQHATSGNPVAQGGMKYTKTKNRAEAYILEQKGINRTGGVKGPKSRNFNKRNSPGKKLLQALKKMI